MAVAPTAYSRSQVALHWLVALGVVIQIGIHDFIVEERAALAAGQPVSDFARAMANAHIAIGLLVGVAVAARLVLRWRHGAPTHRAGKSRVSARLADAMHFGLYAALVAMVLTGIATASGLANLAGLHLAIDLAMVAMIIGHAGAAFWNQFILRDGTLTRMLPARRRLGDRR